MRLFHVTVPALFLLPGLDHRFGWSHLPLWLTIFSQTLVLGGWVMMYWVMKVYSFAGSTIQVEPGQHLISTGPYRIVRHPMYLGAGVMLLFSPLALGSYFAFPALLSSSPFLFSGSSTRRRFSAKSYPATPNIVSAPDSGSFPFSGKTTLICKKPRRSA